MIVKSTNPQIQSAIDLAYSIGMAQHSDEIVPFAEAVATGLKPNLVLEIGSHKGTAALWLSLVEPGGGVYSIDLPNGPWGGISEEQAHARTDMLAVYAESLGKNFAGFLGDSKSPEAAKFAQGAADAYGQFYDMIFIDGDHSYEGVRKDLDLALQLIRDGGWIVLHDIIEGPIHERDKVEVSKLWREVQSRAGRTKEFIGSDRHWGGIGVVIV